jgi:hypothetical protein
MMQSLAAIGRQASVLDCSTAIIHDAVGLGHRDTPVLHSAETRSPWTSGNGTDLECNIHLRCDLRWSTVRDAGLPRQTRSGPPDRFPGFAV